MGPGSQKKYRDYLSATFGEAVTEKLITQNRAKPVALAKYQRPASLVTNVWPAAPLTRAGARGRGRISG